MTDKEKAKEEAWGRELKTGDDLEEEFTALLSSFPLDDAYKIFAGGFFGMGWDAALSASSGTPEDEEQAFLAAWKEHANSEYVGDEQIAYGHAWAKAKEHFSASSGWVDVEQGGFPDKERNYLVLTHRGFTRISYFSPAFFKAHDLKKWGTDGGYVVRWMPIPPFTVEENKV